MTAADPLKYVPAGKDGFGGRFIFLREMNGQPFINRDTGEVRFTRNFRIASRSIGESK
jgi:hypothetical protein